MNVLKKHTVNLDTYNNWYFDTTGLLGHKIMATCYRYKYPAGTDTVHQLVFLYVTFKGEQVAYVRIEDNNYPDKRVLLKYVDSVYTAGVLAAYNAKHQTDFSWSDLYEDDWDRFTTDVGFTSTTDDLDSSGIPSLLTGGLSYEIKICIPLIKNKDHHAIEKFTKSFNPVRKAYGATCLYVIQQLGEPLSIEEKELLKAIRQSKETIDYSHGCLVQRQKRINAILTKRELDYISVTVQRVIAYK